MEPFAKAKRRAFGLGISHEQERPSVVFRTIFAAITPERLNPRAISPIIGACVPPRPCTGSVALIGIAGGRLLERDEQDGWIGRHPVVR